MKPRGKRRWLAAFVVLLLLALLVPPLINLRRFHQRITGALADAVGRPVSVGEIHLRLLPQPGFDLENFVLADDPAFSPEPVLRADEVTAALSLSSLWRGRLEIARISLKDPSVNLVRDREARWNIESLLRRAAQLPAAPTATRPQARARFPYIEAEGAQINFKLGDEKVVYALRDADFALWLASEEEWRMRLEARPIRTDAALSDTGSLRIEASVQRTGDQRGDLLQVHLGLDRAQLGQFTKLVLGRDLGWRGNLSADADLAGTPSLLTLSLRSSLQDFRRYDIAATDSLGFQGLCTATYHAAGALLSGIECHLPLGNGEIAVRGAVADLFAARRYDLSIAANDIPGPVLAAIARHAKRGLPPDLDAAADLDAAFTLRTPPSPPGAPAVWAGGGTIADLTLRSEVLAPALRLSTVAFTLVNAGQAQPGLGLTPPARLPTGSRIAILPVNLPLGGAGVSFADGWLSSTGYHFDLEGDAELRRLLQVGDALGLRPPKVSAAGGVRASLQVDGRWNGFGAPVLTGSAQLRNVAAQMKGVAAPVQVSSVTLAISEDRVSVQKLAASLGGTGISFTGSLELARGCDPLPSCPATFDLHAGTVPLDELNRVLNPRLRPQSWFPLGRPAAESNLARLQAQGTIAVDRLLLKSVAVTRIEAQVRIADSRVDVTHLQAQLLGGRHRGEWHADFSGRAPVYSGSGTVEGTALAQVALAMRDPWAAGTAGGSYRLTLSGWSAPELVSSLAGSMDFDWRGGVLRHLVLGETRDPLRFQRFTGHALLRDSTFTLSGCRLQTPQGSFTVSGTASLGRQLDLGLARESGPGYSVSGSLARPRVKPTPGPATQAELKP